MTPIDRLHITLGKPTQGRCHGIAAHRRREEMDMVVHQYISVYGDLVFNNHLLQQTQVVAPILVVDEDSGAVNAAMCDVQRHTR